jgi:iron complex outermembrane receptor protein
MGQWRLGSNINYRGSLSNKLEASDTECAQTTANGSDFPKGCRVASFTSTDLSVLFRASKQLEYSLGVSNVFDTKPATDFETYGAIGYYPLDYVGAIGRAFKVSVRYAF